jgi:hypothetical protein
MADLLGESGTRRVAGVGRLGPHDDRRASASQLEGDTVALREITATTRRMDAMGMAPVV